MRELQHRVKNSLAIVSSLLGLELKNLNDEHSRRIFEDARNRIQAMSIIYEHLYLTESFSNVDLQLYVDDLVKILSRAYIAGKSAVNITADINNINLNLKRTVPLGLILNELITNSLEYAYPAAGGGRDQGSN